MKKSAQAISPGPITLDVLGLSLTAADRERILHPLTGGVILFARNFSDREQLLKLTTSIKTLRPDVLISIDHEGGRVQRCKKDGFTHLPAMGRLGELWLTNRKKAIATSYLASYGLVALILVLHRCSISIFSAVASLVIGLFRVTPKLSLPWLKA